MDKDAKVVCSCGRTITLDSEQQYSDKDKFKCECGKEFIIVIGKS